MCIQQATEELTRKIQQKKEELYDVICKAEQSIWTSSFSNKRLLQHLSVQVEPRQGAKWYENICSFLFLVPFLRQELI
jgi:RNase adaptor protein for sRNA GlmZ degradation